MIDKIILVDMDGVLADFEKSLSAKLKLKYPEIKSLYKQRTNFNFDEDYPELDRQKIREIYASQDFFVGLEPIAGSLEALRTLDYNNSVFICTSPLTLYQNCVKEKYDWIANHLGKEWVKKIVLTKDKTIVHGDILIDDKPVISGAITPSWKHYVFEAPYNLGERIKPRINWDNYLEVLKSHDFYEISCRTRMSFT